MTDMNDMLAAASTEVEQDKVVSLADISAIANKQLSLEHEIKAAEEYLSNIKSTYNKIKTIELPEAMLSVGMKSLELADGSTVKVEPFYSISIKKDFKEEALNWLEINGYGDIIKCSVETAFKKEEFEQAIELAEALVEEGYPAAASKGVHASTLKSWFKNHEEIADTIPGEYFSYHIGQVTKLKESK